MAERYGWDDDGSLGGGTQTVERTRLAAVGRITGYAFILLSATTVMIVVVAVALIMFILWLGQHFAPGLA